MYDKLIEGLIKEKAYKATYFITEKEVARATRTRYGGRKFNTRGLEVTISRCKPNFLEREYIKRSYRDERDVMGTTWYRFVPKTPTTKGAKRPKSS